LVSFIPSPILRRCCPLPPEIGRIRGPDVKSLGNMEFGQQTLFELLLTEDLQ
jgi:hypothetical protein